MTSKMIDHLNSLENVTVMLETTGTGLITNQANEVIGATAEGKDGSMVIYADNVVLATSGFAANKEMLEKYIPEIVDAYPMVAPGATGEGILWGMSWALRLRTCTPIRATASTARAWAPWIGSC